MRNAFTVDVEDYFHVQSFAKTVHPRDWDQHESRVVANTRRILRLLENHQVHGTFFILGWVADRFPELVQEIHQAGHEIGCHSFWHRLIYNMTPEDFREDLLQGCKAIEEITDQRVTAFRAPSFSITEQSLWALDILIEEGFRYDSSIFPVYHDTYGIPDADRFPHRIEGSRGALWEFPPSVHRLGKLNVPVAGGGYFRLYPAWLSSRWLSRINRIENRPFVFYIHPWELDPDQPRLPGSLRSRFRHYQNLRTTESKLATLLERFHFASLSDALSDHSRDGARAATHALHGYLDTAVPR
ncbi:MAG: XrtA system polysaccharide deacetylase [Planctomycetota bacterium]